MGTAKWIFSFKLKKGVTQEDFISATQQLHDEVVSKAKGFLCWEQYVQGEVWTDLVTWETIEDANNALEVGQGNAIAEKFYGMLQMHTCRSLVTSLVHRYEIDQ